MRKRFVVNHQVVVGGLFTIGSFLFIELHYRYWYRFLEQYMMFQTTAGYLRDRLSEPGGMNEYVSEALSLAFGYPGGAAAVIALLLGALSGGFHLFLKACRANSAAWLPVAPAFLFWLSPQESIASTTALLFAVWMAWIYTRIPDIPSRYTLGFLLLAVSYFLLAPAHLWLALLMAVHACCVGDGRKRFLAALLFVAWSGVLPLLAMRTIYILPMREAYFSKHLCHPEYPMPVSLWWQALSLPVLTLVGFFLRGRTFIPRESMRVILTYAVVLLAMGYGLLARKHPLEQAYRYDLYARQEAWEKIVDHARAHSIRDKDALIYLNLALSHTGRFTTDLFRFRQIGEEGFVSRDPRTRMGLIEASEVAWQVGQVNAAQRFAFVGVLSARRMVQPRLMKRLVETYLVTGEYRAAEKYIKLLEASPLYRDWAKARRPLLDPAVCASTDWVAAKRATLPITDNPFDLTKTFPSALAFLVDDHIDNHPAFDYAMGYLLIYKDLMTFMHYMELLKERGDTLPVLYQEAICLFFSAVRKDPAMLQTYPIGQEVRERFGRFTRMARDLPPAALKEQFGDTYYYYARFVPTPKQK